MAGCEHHGGESATREREIEVRGHPEPGQALVGDLLHAEAVAADLAEAPRRHRPGSRRQAADQAENRRARLGAAAFGGRAAGDRRHCPGPRVELPEGNRVEVIDELRARVLRQSGRKGERAHRERDGRDRHSRQHVS